MGHRFLAAARIFSFARIDEISVSSVPIKTLTLMHFDANRLKILFYFRIFHKATADNETFSIIETRLLWARINNLKPNSQHVVYVVAIGAKGESLPSETLVAWTDPAIPAFVDVNIN